MSFVAIVFTSLAVVLLALIALGLWHRRRPSDIWEEDVGRSSTRRSQIEQRDVEEYFGTHPPQARDSAEGSDGEEGGPPSDQQRGAER